MPVATVATYVPYRKNGDSWEFFLQKRDGNAPTHPNIFSLFGGGIEDGEDSEVAVLREIHEELAYEPKALNFFPRQFVSDADGRLFDVYIEEVPQGFENQVTVLEGEYGRFMSTGEIVSRDDVSRVGKEIVVAIHASLTE